MSDYVEEIEGYQLCKKCGEPLVSVAIQDEEGNYDHFYKCGCIVDMDENMDEWDVNVVIHDSRCTEKEAEWEEDE